MIRAHQIRLHPTPEQAEYFVKAAGTRRFVYNWGLAEWQRQYEAGEKPSAGYIAGSGGNAAIMAMTRAMGAVSTRDGVRVVGLNPGLIETERMITLSRTKAEAEFGDPERWRETIDQVLPPGKPEHIGDMVAFLASDLSSNTTGTIITIDGGSSMRGGSI